MARTLLGSLALLTLILAAGIPSAAAQVTGLPFVFGGGSETSAAAGRRVMSTVGQMLVGRSEEPGASSRVAWVGICYLLPAHIATSVDIPAGRSGKNWLGQNTPNPFNPATTIRFAIAEPGPVRLRLFNLRGEHVADLVDASLDAGEHTLVLRPTELSSGTYLYRLEAPGFQATRRFLLLK